MKPDLVRVVLIGTGGFGKAHARLWQQTPGAELVGVYDSAPEVAQQAAEKLELKRVYRSLEEAVGEPRADAVDVCTPNRAHAPVAIAALDAGKHCLCEKPLAPTAEEIRRMIVARDRSGKLLMTAQHMRFEQRSLALKKLIDAGDLGRVYYARARWLRRRMAPTTPGFLSREQAVHGPGLDLGVHVLDLAMHFMGHPKPTAVSGFTARELARQQNVGNQWGQYRSEDFEVEDFAAALIRFAGGAALTLEVSWLFNMSEPETCAVSLHGTGGGACWPDLRLNCVREGLLVNSQIISNTADEGHKNELEAFCDAIRGGGRSPVPAEQSLTIARILEALYASAESHREVRL